MISFHHYWIIEKEKKMHAFFLHKLQIYQCACRYAIKLQTQRIDIKSNFLKFLFFPANDIIRSRKYYF